MEYYTAPGTTYSVVSTAGCKITTGGGVVIKNLPAGQGYFTAMTSVTLISDDSAIVREITGDMLVTLSPTTGGGGASSEELKAAVAAAVASAEAAGVAADRAEAAAQELEADIAQIDADRAAVEAMKADVAADRTAVEGMKSDVATLKEAAESAKTAAELAETNAESAKTEAESAKTAAELAETNAESAGQGALEAFAGANDAYEGAVNAAATAATKANEALAYRNEVAEMVGVSGAGVTIATDGSFQAQVGALYACWGNYPFDICKSANDTTASSSVMTVYSNLQSVFIATQETYYITPAPSGTNVAELTVVSRVVSA